MIKVVFQTHCTKLFIEQTVWLDLGKHKSKPFHTASRTHFWKDQRPKKPKPEKNLQSISFVSHLKSGTNLSKHGKNTKDTNQIQKREVRKKMSDR